MNALSSFLLNRFPALSHALFRRYWVGQLISLSGGWIQQTAISWFIIETTHSTLKLSIVGMISCIPSLLFSLFAGYILDHFPKSRVLLFALVLSLLQALVLFFSFRFDVLSFHLLLLLTFWEGLAENLEIVSRQSLVADLVEKKHLYSAIGLNSIANNVARTVTPAIVGFLLHLYGGSFCFLLNAFSFLPVIISVYSMRHSLHWIQSSVQPVSNKMNDIFSSIGQSFRYVISTEMLRHFFVLAVVQAVFLSNTLFVIPASVEVHFSNDPRIFGISMGCFGFGAFFGALRAASHRAKNSLQTPIIASTICVLTISILAFATSVYLFFPILVIFGFASVFGLIKINNGIQYLTPDALRGRIMSIYTLLLSGGPALGRIFMGVVIEKTSLAAGFMCTVFCAALIGMSYFLIQNRSKSSYLPLPQTESEMSTLT